MYSRIGSAKLNGLDLRRCLADALIGIADRPVRQKAELLPRKWRPVEIARAAAVPGAFTARLQ